MARARRRLLGAALGVAGGALLAVGIALSSGGVQTWLVREALAKRPDWHATVGRVQLGWGRAVVEDLQWRKGPLAVRVPVAEADFAVWPLVTSGHWRFGTIQVGAAEVALMEAGGPVLPNASGVLEAISRGFGSWELPLATEIERLELAGAVRVPGWPAATRLKVSGGGLGVGREARLELDCQAETGSSDIARVGAVGTLTIRMRSALRPDHLGFEGEVRAAGARWPQPVRVSLALAATDHGAYQDYRVTGWTDERPLLAWDARMTDAVSQVPARMSGTWMIDLRPGDLTPLLPGSPLTVISLRSEGRFEAAEPFGGFELEGNWHAASDAPQRFWPRWPAESAARSEGRFRLRQSGDVSRVSLLHATLEAGSARATLAADRPFEVRWQGGLVASTAQAEQLASLELVQWPWVLAPADILLGAEVSGGAVNGRMAVWPREGGWSFRSMGPLVTEPMTWVAAARTWVRGASARAEVTLDWLPAGWQLDVRHLALRGASGDYGHGELKSGQLAGPGQPLKVAGKLTLDLGRAGRLPFWPEVAWRGGELSADLAASLGAVRGWRAELELRGGLILEGTHDVTVPALKVDARAEVDANGRLAFDWPLVIGDGDSRRDLRWAGTFRSDASGGKWDASVSGQRLRGEDLASLAVLFGQPESWAARLLAGEGRIGFRLGRLEFAGGRDLQAVEADLTVKESVGVLSAQAAWLPGGTVALKADLRADPGAGGVAAVAGEVSALQVGAAELWRMMGSADGWPVEGMCDASLRFAGTVAAPLAKTGEISVVSRGGAFLGLPVSFLRVAESTNRLTTWLASAGLAFNALTGRSTEAEIAGRSQAVAELVRGLNPMSFDQFALRAERDPNVGWRVRELALIAPELRLLGEGTVGGAGGNSAPLELALQWRARGRTAELLQYLGVLEENRDSLGYARCALPIRLAGTLGRRDATELNQRLAALSVEKPGMVDKALEFLGRWRNRGAEGPVKP